MLPSHPSLITCSPVSQGWGVLEMVGLISVTLPEENSEAIYLSFIVGVVTVVRLCTAAESGPTQYAHI